MTFPTGQDIISVTFWDETHWEFFGKPVQGAVSLA